VATENVAQAISGIRKKFPNMDSLNEVDVRSYIIDKILGALDWDLTEPGEVKKEYTVGKDKADYALNPHSPTAVFVEAKKPAENLEKHQGQLLRYCFQEAVDLAVLTNGRTWWLYLPRYDMAQGEKLHWTQKRFSEIDITSGGPKVIQTQFEKFLAKEKVSSGEAVEAAKGEIDERRAIAAARKEMAETWNTVLTVPSEGLIKLLTESTASLKDVKPNRRQALVKEFFQNHRAQFKVPDFGPPKQKPPTNRGKNGRPSLLIFQGMEYPVKTSKEALLRLCELMYADPHRPGSFDQIISVQGTKNLYFSRNPDDLAADSNFEPIGDSGIFAATAPLSAGGVKKRCQEVLRSVGYDPENCFRIE
jgi:hypothetical protein